MDEAVRKSQGLRPPVPKGAAVIVGPSCKGAVSDEGVIPWRVLAREYLSLHHCERMDTLLPASGRKMKVAGCSILTRYGKCKQHDDLVLMLLKNSLKSPVQSPAR